MEVQKKNYSQVLEFGEGDVERAKAIIKEELGEDFSLEAGNLPKNIGIKGDVGVLGETVMIVAGIEHPARFITENQNLFDHTIGRLTGEIDAITRVLYQIIVRDS